jgi:hypothetical protein
MLENTRGTRRPHSSPVIVKGRRPGAARQPVLPPETETLRWAQQVEAEARRRLKEEIRGAARRVR